MEIFSNEHNFSIKNERSCGKLLHFDLLRRYNSESHAPALERLAGLPGLRWIFCTTLNYYFWH